MSVEQLIARIKTRDDCHVLEPNSLPLFHDGHLLPEDLRKFYEVCGGVSLYQHANYPIHIVQPQNVILANPVIVGSLCEGDISSSWYIIANDGMNEFLTIDLHPDRLGRCYDSFYDRHAVAGASKIIANSFTDLLGVCCKSRKTSRIVLL